LSQAGHRKFSAYNPQTGRSLAGSSPSARLRSSVSIVPDQVRRRGMGTTKRGRTGSGQGDRFRPKPQDSYARRPPHPLLGGGGAYQAGAHSRERTDQGYVAAFHRWCEPQPPEALCVGSLQRRPPQECVGSDHQEGNGPSSKLL
jgi:hypothetical protein